MNTSYHNNEFRLERYEMKYVIPFEMVEQISRFIEPYCRLDKYSEIAYDHFYTIRSLYLDTPTRLFMRQRLNKCNDKLSMRIRSYGEKIEPPWFFEVKKKKGNIVNKFRSRQNDNGTDHNHEYLLKYLTGNNIDKNEDANLSLFRSLYYNYGVEPQLILQYRRKAYFSEIDDYARVTFDTGLCYSSQNNWTLLNKNQLEFYDYSAGFTNGCTVILELKCCCTQVPLWMMDLVRCFDLQRQRFSKYVQAQIQMKQKEERFENGDRICLENKRETVLPTFNQTK